MSSATRLPSTRASLVRCRRRLAQVRKGAALLRRKRESLVRELFARARPAVSGREAIEAQARAAWQALWAAHAAQADAQMAPLGWPTRDLQVDLATTELWGMTVAALGRPVQVVRDHPARGVLASADEAPALDAAAEFERLLEQLIAAAPQEHLMRRLGQALSRTTRLVNTLEQRVAVQLAADLARIARTLDEREREEHHRIRQLASRRRTPPRP